MTTARRHLLVLGTLALFPTAVLSTPNTDRSICRSMSGAPFGLCQAYCVAQDCPGKDDVPCENLRRNLAKHTGSTVFPCDETVTTTTTTA